MWTCNVRDWLESLFPPNKNFHCERGADLLVNAYVTLVGSMRDPAHCPYWCVRQLDESGFLGGGHDEQQKRRGCEAND
jgi:hypothetical protein